MAIDNYVELLKTRVELTATRQELERVKGLLEVAQCPQCDGSGACVEEVPVHACCGNALPSGECCGNSVMEIELEQSACQWCYERSELTKTTKNEE